MFERERVIAGLRKEQNVLRELIEALEDAPNMGCNQVLYCDQVLKNIESTLKKLRRPLQGYGKYAL